MSTADLHEFWRDYGGFPTQYYVRLEEIKIWEVIKPLLPDIGMNRIVLLGSPGVGKSCFLMLGDVWNSLVYFDGNGSVAQASNVVLEHLTEIRKWIAMTPSNERPMVLVDGLTQKEMANHWDLQQFHILATSCQYSAKHDDHVVQVAMPAWRLEDLLMYAKSTVFTTPIVSLSRDGRQK
ncbi:hypothetical protein Poli38472_006663 [Pythium oligandrum]|uniref:Uncharacterized protein n=1 Tax=Pythium oligandrum TaxID=41045 RepID=A0A8K1FFC2_PYTOL|nr:hypothetical protein Poli38472_006663 [Pythium oligandrum]|eukprot:TMW56653.1 hypothetical protein Poli38472_006663 [Pythium oligandrum]